MPRAGYVANLEWVCEVKKHKNGRPDWATAFQHASSAMVLFDRKANGGAYQGDTVRVELLPPAGPFKPRRLRLLFSASKRPLSRLCRLDSRFRILRGSEQIVVK